MNVSVVFSPTMPILAVVEHSPVEHSLVIFSDEKAFTKYMNREEVIHPLECVHFPPVGDVSLVMALLDSGLPALMSSILWGTENA